MSDRGNGIFWMVVGDGPATVRHHNKAAAEREAERLASLHPGTNFYVLRSVSMFRKVAVERRDFPLTDEDIPF